jgi:hypothetical protein
VLQLASSAVCTTNCALWWLCRANYDPFIVYCPFPVNSFFCRGVNSYLISDNVGMISSCVS